MKFFKLFNKLSKKEISELSYWQDVSKKEKTFYNKHYKPFYTKHFGLDDDFYKNKKIIDIGCGPRGSLEWADMASERYGLDPLADEYLKLGSSDQQMKYVQAYSENIPFDDGYFDVVCSFNSIDHVENLKKSCQELARILKKGGLLLLLTDLHDEPTTNEPQIIKWDFIEKYFGDLKIIEENHYEKLENGMYQSLEKAIPFDHNNDEKRYGILSAKLMK